MDFLETDWGLILVAGAMLVAFLKWYDVLRNKGRSFLCDILKLIGKDRAFNMCQEAPPSTREQMELLEFLKKNEHTLSPEQSEQLESLERHLANQVLEQLKAAAGITDAPLDTRAEEDKRNAVHATIREGDEHELRAMELIAEGNTDSGLNLLVNNAEQAAQENIIQWRRIGKIAFGVDKARALSAYEKVVALDRSDPWDAIYLARLYTSTGNLGKSLSTLRDTLSYLPQTEERTRSVLYNEIGNVQVAQGDLPAALKSYSAAMEIREVLAKSDPANSGWQAGLAASYGKLGQLMVQMDKPDKALELFRKGRALVAPLVEKSEHVLWKQYLDYFDAEIAALED